MNKIISFFAPWLMPVMTTLLLAAVGFAWVCNGKVNRAEKTISDLREELRIEKSTSSTNLETAKLCSASVANLHEAAVKAAAKSKLAIAAARKQSAASQSAGSETLQTPMAVPADQCASIVDLTTSWKAKRTSQ